MFRRRRRKLKDCKHFEDVAKVCDRVLSGEIPPSDLGTTTLAEEYLLLLLEHKALRTHLDETGR